MSKKVLSLIICTLLAFGSAATALAADTTEDKPHQISILTSMKKMALPLLTK